MIQDEYTAIVFFSSHQSNTRIVTTTNMFSCTAPVITEADEQAERAALTKAESLAIESDLYGYTETPTQERFNLPNLQASLAEMQECLQAISRKDDYQQALQHNLVERESNPIRFLRSEEFHPAAAAQRVVEYWKLRKKAFGADAYLPLTLDAALEPQVEFLRRGAVRWLPNDEKGRLVLFMDRVRCFDLGMSRNDILRCVFYLLHCGQERGEDFVLVCNLKRLELYKVRFESSGLRSCVIPVRVYIYRSRVSILVVSHIRILSLFFNCSTSTGCLPREPLCYCGTDPCNGKPPMYVVDRVGR